MGNSTAISVRLATKADHNEWLRMRVALLPDFPEEHDREIALFFAGTPGFAVFVAERPEGKLCGFVEVGQRAYAEGCDTSPVGYIEAWYVDPDCRRQGVGRALIAAAEQWALAQGYTEMASDALIDNTVSEAAHKQVGFAEVERIICFHKSLI